MQEISKKDWFNYLIDEPISGESLSNLKEFLTYASEQNITPTSQAYADWATNVKGLGKQFDFAKIKAVALNAAMNAAVSIGISLAIQGIVSAISYAIHYNENLIETANELTEAYEEQRKALSANKNTISEISADYERLANGVDNLGRNVSLNTEEYTRYNDIVNQIAEMFPQMVQGYTDEGNATAAILLVDSNLQRENILPSEKAYAYRMKLEAMERKRGRPLKENSGQLVPNFSGKRATEIIGEENGESYKQVQRYIRLTELIDPLLNLVDEKRLPLNAAVELSYSY